MKADIHPDYHFVSVTLADGTTYRTRSTMKAETYTSDVDSSNHPFYTGKKTLVDTAGRVEKFMRRYGKAQAGTIPDAEPEAEADATAETADTTAEG